MMIVCDCASLLAFVRLSTITFIFMFVIECDIGGLMVCFRDCVWLSAIVNVSVYAIVRDGVCYGTCEGARV